MQVKKKQILGVSYFLNQDESSVKGICFQSCVCVFKEGINLASYTFACFLAPKPDLWTASEEPPGTMSSLHNIWLVFQWSKPTRHYESNVNENMFSALNRQAFGGEEGLLVGGTWRVIEKIWVTTQRKIQQINDSQIQKKSSFFPPKVLLSVSNTVLPALAYPLCCISELSSSADMHTESHKLENNQIKMGISCSRGWQYPQALSVGLNVCFLCGEKTNHKGGILTHWLHHTPSQASKKKVSISGRKRQKPVSTEGSMKHRRRHNARAGSPLPCADCQRLKKMSTAV